MGENTKVDYGECVDRISIKNGRNKTKIEQPLAIRPVFFLGSTNK